MRINTITKYIIAYERLPHVVFAQLLISFHSKSYGSIAHIFTGYVFACNVAFDGTLQYHTS